MIPSFCAHRYVLRISRYRESALHKVIRSSRYSSSVLQVNGISRIVCRPNVCEKLFSSDSHENVREGRKISKEDEHHEETKRKRLSEVLISEVLKAKALHRWVDPKLTRTATIKEAVVSIIEGGLCGAMVVEHEKVVGLITSRDLLRIIAGGIRKGYMDADILKQVVGDHMTPISQVIYGRPEETIGRCRTVMTKLGIKCLPILSKEGRVEGLITARDMNEYGLTAAERGGKSAYLTDVAERVGLSSDTSMAEPPTYLKAQLDMNKMPLYINIGVSALPHPYKTPQGVARGIRGKAMSTTTRCQ